MKQTRTQLIKTRQRKIKRNELTLDALYELYDNRQSQNKEGSKVSLKDIGQTRRDIQSIQEEIDNLSAQIIKIEIDKVNLGDIRY